ncbi:class I SAM-dependent methyltransferase [Novosphingobium sp. KCTC 2891]|uniref:class I SAM-dependent methyltransferase n=1 Tax=Novosphingobium sp. KCTC 2891 TaxID=2989730 RepID=UPI0022225B49|nr:class I SAM-dependent methyltransferase [Novosphingobium sp. KCTC 2891]MCW1381842.1 class I SAM-dependent methyltransferase [Novosphingobium sp. KCTC 2891]
MASAPPTIFSPARRLALRRRMHVLQTRPGAARFLAEDMAEDVLDRLSFLRHEPRRALVIGDLTGTVAAGLAAQGAEVVRADPLPMPGEIRVDEEQPLPFAEGFDFIASLGTLDTVNDLPGAMVHLRRALRPDGLAIISFPGAGSLATLRAIMLEADGERPAARIHPQVDVRAGGQLLQRCGFGDPVVDSRALKVRYGTLRGLVDDVRAQGLGSALQRAAPPLGRTALARAEAAFAARADADGRVTELFEILTLSGWARAPRPSRFDL